MQQNKTKQNLRKLEIKQAERFWKGIDTWKKETALGEFPFFVAFRLGSVMKGGVVKIL